MKESKQSPAAPESSDSFWDKLSRLFSSQSEERAADTVPPSTEIDCKADAPDLQLQAPLESIARVLYQTDRVPPPCEQLIDQPFSEDAINIKANGQCIKGNRIIDTVIGSALDQQQGLAKRAHRDGVQLIPTQAQVGNYQFMAGVLQDIVIEDNHIESKGLLQGIFASDGVFRNISIANNCINTQAEHKITLNGLLSGQISNNRDAAGKLLPIYLGPLRIGGNLATGNVWILSFAADEDHRYAPLSEMIPDSDKGSDPANPYPHVRDERYQPQNRSGAIGDTNLYAFPLERFKQHLSGVTIEYLLALQTNLDSLFHDWLGRLCQILSEAQLNALKEAYQAERNVPIGQIKHQALRHYFLQALAKQLGSLEDPMRSKV
ncbi:hypothetical protein [Thiofilum flexile]|uniref:hypothetical protein n=1 Tax=Thiofilum flexile TaxID=125627 RepID=UPI00037B2263|nr:hypothetical protein [Thiofilum flexile]